MGDTLLLTGPPGCGKTTCIRTLLTQLRVEAGGFYTEEIREGRARTGFRLVTLDGNDAVLAHVGMHSRHRIGRYGVDLVALNEVGVKSLTAAVARRDLVVVDEIGPMELLSDQFRNAVLEAIESRTPVLGSIMQRKSPFAEEIKALPQVHVVQLSRSNRDAAVRTILKHLQDVLGTPEDSER